MPPKPNFMRVKGGGGLSSFIVSEARYTWLLRGTASCPASGADLTRMARNKRLKRTHLLMFKRGQMHLPQALQVRTHVYKWHAGCELVGGAPDGESGEATGPHQWILIRTAGQNTRDCFRIDASLDTSGPTWSRLLGWVGHCLSRSTIRDSDVLLWWKITKLGHL